MSHSLNLALDHTYDPTTKKLTIRNQDIFPNEILNFAEDIEILDMSHGHINTLPGDFSKLTKLRVLFMSHNDFTEVPSILAACPELRTIGMVACKISHITTLPPTLEALILTNNQIEQLPTSIGQLPALKKLTLTGNLLRDLPRELQECSTLELVRLAANQFQALPYWMLNMPSLAWYADAGNPGSVSEPVAANSIDWADIRITEELGASSKNTVYAGTLVPTDQEVAVKVFGEEISADGAPNDEIRACLSIPFHPSLIETLGEVAGAPDNRRRLVMARVPSSYSSLGNPPTLRTVTRDTYGDASFGQSFCIRVLHDVASALEHLHGHHIMHGDVYAHNILVDSAGKAILTDLGAASFYEAAADNHHELVEVQAFGHLAQELLDRIRLTPENIASAQTFLEALTAKCLLSSPADRPTFTEISSALSMLLKNNPQQ